MNLVTHELLPALESRFVRTDLFTKTPPHECHIASTLVIWQVTDRVKKCGNIGRLLIECQITN